MALRGLDLLGDLEKAEPSPPAGAVRTRKHREMPGSKASLPDDAEVIFFDRPRRPKVDSPSAAATSPSYDLAAAEAWLEALYRSGALKRIGRVPRSEMEQHFGWPSCATFHHAEIRKLVLAYDKRVRGDIPGVSLLPLLQEDLRDLIDSGECPLKGDGTINRTAAARLLGVSPSAFCSSPELSSVCNIEDRRREQEASSEIYKAGTIIDASALFSAFEYPGRNTPYSLARLVPYYGRHFVSLIVGCMGSYIGNYARNSADHHVHAVLNLLSYLPADATTAASVVEPLKEGRRITSAAWEQAVWQWRSHRIGPDPATASGTHAQDVTRVNEFLKHTARTGILPQIEPVRGLRNARLKSKRMRTIVEAAARSTPDDLEAAVVGLVDSDISADDRKWARSSFEAMAGDPDYDPADPVGSWVKITDRRLDRLRAIMSEVILRWQSHWIAGQAAIARAGDASAVDRAFSSDTPSNWRKTNERRLALFDNTIEGCVGTGRSRLLRYFQDYRGGFISTENPAGELVFSKWVGAFGGAELLDAFLNPHVEACVATIILTMIETAANLGTVLQTPTPPLEPTDGAGHMAWTGFKMRAAGSAIVKDLPVKIPGSVSAVQAIQWLDLAYTNHRATIIDERNSPFFIHCPSKEEAVPIAEHVVRERMLKLTHDDAELGRLRILPSQIRVSLLMRSSLTNDGRLSVVADLGAHRQHQTSRGYTRDSVDDLVRSGLIRKFQNALQAVFIPRIPGAVALLGLDHADLAVSEALLEKTGLGTYCKGFYGADRAEPTGSGSCATFNCFECHQCVVVARARDIAELLIWGENLRAAEPRWVGSQPKVWIREYLPWIAFVEVVNEKMQRGPLRRVLREAEAIAIELRDDPGYHAPEPC